MLTTLTIGGGIALILFGVRFLRKGLDRLFGNKLPHMVRRLAGNRIKAMCTGFGVAVAAPSSTTISLLAVRSVQDKHLGARQMLALMLGANVGLTTPVILLSLGAEAFAPILVFAGVLMFQFNDRRVVRGIGQILLALGLVFMGVHIIKDMAHVVGGNADLIKLIQIVEHYPILMCLMAAILASLLQSSTATIGLVIGLAAADEFSLPIAVAVVIGANIGIAVTTAFIGWRETESQRLAAGNLLAKVGVAAVVFVVFDMTVRAFALLPTSQEMQIAATHVAFNLTVAIVGLPMTSVLYNIAQRLIPDKPQAVDPEFRPRYLSHSLLAEGSMTICLSQSMREIMHVSEILRHMMKQLWTALETNDEDLARQISSQDDDIDLLDEEIKHFLTRLTEEELGPDETRMQLEQLRYLNDLETAGDILDKNLSQLVIKKARLQVQFSDAGWKELCDFFDKVSENVLIADTVFLTRDRALAQKLLRHKARLAIFKEELRDQHFKRLKEGSSQSHETSAIHLDILTHLERLNDTISHVCYAILQAESARRN